MEIKDHLSLARKQLNELKRLANRQKEFLRETNFEALWEQIKKIERSVYNAQFLYDPDIQPCDLNIKVYIEGEIQE